MDTQIIDVHAHALTASYLEGLAELGVCAVEEDGFPTPTWSAEDAAAFADEQGIDFSVLSISTPHIHRGDDEAACRIARKVNDELAAMCHAQPKRFGFAALLPLPCVEGSVAEARRAYDELGALGVKVPSNACGVYLGNRMLDPLYEFLDERRAVVTIHPSLPQERPMDVFTAGPAPLFEYLVDTTRTVLDLVAAGTIRRYPNIRWIVPHCGSFLPEVAHRLVGISQVLVPAGLMQQTNALADLATLYYDLAGNAQPVMLDALLKIVDPSHLLYGSDYPYTPAPAIARQREELLANAVVAAHVEDVFYGNAARLYGMQS